MDFSSPSAGVGEELLPEGAVYVLQEGEDGAGSGEGGGVEGGRGAEEGEVEVAGAYGVPELAELALDVGHRVCALLAVLDQLGEQPGEGGQRHLALLPGLEGEGAVEDGGEGDGGGGGEGRVHGAGGGGGIGRAVGGMRLMGRAGLDEGVVAGVVATRGLDRRHGESETGSTRRWVEGGGGRKKAGVSAEATDERNAQPSARHRCGDAAVTGV